MLVLVRHNKHIESGMGCMYKAGLYHHRRRSGHKDRVSYPPLKGTERDVFKSLHCCVHYNTGANASHDILYKL